MRDTVYVFYVLVNIYIDAVEHKTCIHVACMHVIWMRVRGCGHIGKQSISRLAQDVDLYDVRQ